jgi:selenocysteine-specific elongation factor
VHVLATAGHVDHGKSTLVRALTGMEPDRWAEERRRGLTIDLGFAWTSLPSGAEVALVDVPGHERFVPNMLAGVGPVPAILFVVAADEGWMPQSAEHLAALDALGVRHGLLVVSRIDLADPRPVRADALERIAGTALGGVEAVEVSAATGAGLDLLTAALDRLVARLPAAQVDAPVRLWVDRAFTIRGAGTVVTGTLPAGRLRVGDELELLPTGRRVRVRGLHALGVPREEVTAVARVAVNLRGVDVDAVRRGDALVHPGAWLVTDVLDVRVRRVPADRVHHQLRLHVGSAAVPARVRPLGPDTARLTLPHPLPLRTGDCGLLRDPGGRGTIAGITVLDVRPPALRRRGAARVRGRELAADSAPDAVAYLRAHGLVAVDQLRAMGLEPPAPPVVGTWVVDPTWWDGRRRALAAVVEQWRREHPLDSGVPVDAARRRLDLPDRRLVEALVRPPLRVVDGRVTQSVGLPVGLSAGLAAGLPAAVAAAVATVRRDLAAAPFAAPEARRLTELGLGPRELAAAARAGLLLRLGDGIALLPDALERASEVLRTVPQPFTLSQAREALATTRRVAVPLLEALDREGRTRRQADDRRHVV